MTDPLLDLEPEAPRPRFTRTHVVLLAVALVVVAGAWGAYHVLTHKDTGDYLREAETALARGDPKAAAIALKNVLQIEPDNAQARYQLGRLYVEVEDYLAAEKALERAQALKHAATDLPLLLARTWLALGQPERVIEALPVAAEAKPSDQAALHALRARAQWMKGERAAAEVSLAAAEALQPEAVELLLTRALMAAAEGERDAALAWVERALKQDGRRAELWLLKGDLLRQGGQRAQAQAAYRQVLALKPEDVPARVALALSLLEADAVAPAAGVLQEAARLSPNHVMVRYLQALIDFRSGKLAEAQSKLQQVLKLDPEFLPGHLLTGAVNLALGNRDTAVSHLQRVVDRAPRHPQARRLLAAALAQGGELAAAERLIAELKDDDDLITLALKGEIAQRRGHPQQAREYLERASALAPDNPDLLMQLAQSRMAAGDREGAVAALERAATLERDSTRPEVLLVQTHLRDGRIDAAMAVIDRLQRERPGDPLPHNLRGIALMAKQDVKQARASFTEALRQDPAFLPAAANLARLDLMDKDTKAARGRFEAVLAKDPGNSRARIALAELALAERDERAFLDQLALAKQANARDPAAYALLARHWLRKGDAARALTEARAGLDATGRGEFHELIGQAHLLNRDTVAAASALAKWVEASPDNPRAHYQLAEAQHLNKANHEAIRSLDRALALAPDFAEALGAKATLLAETGRGAEGLKLAADLQRKQPKSPAGYVAEAEILAKSGRFTEAATVFARAAEVAGSGRLALRALEAWQRANQAAQGIAWLEDWLVKRPDDVPVRHGLALALIQAGRLKEAAGHYERLYQAQPRNAVVANNLAWLYGELKDPRALKTAEQAYALSPDDPSVLDTLGWLLVNSGEVQRGRGLLEKAARLAPDAPAIQYHHAAALARAGDTRAALAGLERLLNGGADFREKAAAIKLHEELKGHAR